jgi:predicted nucleic acid-binding protein
MAIKRKRIDEKKAKELMRVFFSYKISLKDVDFQKTFAIAQKYNLSIYDASYVQLAKQMRIKLLTFDNQLSRLSVIQSIPS